jgi:polysaccharide biosynthesis protein PslG
MALLLAVAAPARSEASLSKAKQQTKQLLRGESLRVVKLSCRVKGRNAKNGYRCRWVAAQLRGKATFACRGSSLLRRRGGKVAMGSRRCSKDRGATRMSGHLATRLVKKNDLRPTSTFCWGLLGRGFLCDWVAWRYNASTFECRGTSRSRNGRYKTRTRGCKLLPKPTAVQAGVCSVLAARGLSPQEIRCRPGSPGFSCDWSATRPSAGWTYRCTGGAGAPGSGGPFSVAPCKLRAPDLAPQNRSGHRPHFGFNDDWPRMTGQIGRAATAGSDTLRFTVSWGHVEATPGVFNFAYYDSVYQAMLREGIRPLLIVQGAPCWATAPAYCDHPGTAPPTPAHDSRWRSFLAEVARRYPQARGIEVWNEANVKFFFKGGPDPARYATLLRLAHEGVRSTGSPVPVISSGLAAYPRNKAVGMGYSNFLRGVYAAGGGKLHADGVGYHAYSGRGPKEDYVSGVRSQIADLKDVMVAYGDQDREIWITETGFPTSGNNAFSPDQQAKALSLIYQSLRSTPGIPLILVHRWRAHTSDGSEAGFGVIEKSGKAKPALCALAKLRGGRC